MVLPSGSNLAMATGHNPITAAVHARPACLEVCPGSSLCLCSSQRLQQQARPLMRLWLMLAVSSLGVSAVWRSGVCSSEHPAPSKPSKPVQLGRWALVKGATPLQGAAQLPSALALAVATAVLLWRLVGARPGGRQLA